MALNKLEKIFAIGMISAASFATAGLITKNKPVLYLGTGMFIGSTCGAILNSKPKESDYAQEDSDKLEYTNK